MHAFLAFLTRRTPPPWVSYGAAIAAVALVTLFRVFVRLDAAPFLGFRP